MSIVLIIILWTWGLTPLWVNIVGTIILSIRFILKVAGFIDYLNESDEVTQ